MFSKKDYERIMFAKLMNKPNIVPPDIREEPEYEAIDKAFAKYEPFMDRLIAIREPSEGLKYRRALIDMFELNFNSISNYVDEFLYNFEYIRKQKTSDAIKSSCTTTAFGSWLIGREWALSDPKRIDNFRFKTKIGIEDVPMDIFTKLLKTVYVPYYLFALIFTEYYESEYGRRTRRQKDGHLKDTYQSIVKASLMCFLDGVKNAKNEY